MAPCESVGYLFSIRPKIFELDVNKLHRQMSGVLCAQLLYRIRTFPPTCERARRLICLKSYHPFALVSLLVIVAKDCLEN